jgi:Outer membrane protein beta-barrel domain
MSNRMMLAATLALLLPAVASAQTPGSGSRPSVVLFANGGGYSPLTDLNTSGTASLNTGWTLGGGGGIQVNRFVAVRAVFDYAQDKGDVGSSAFAGAKIKRYFYGGDIQLRYPTANGFAPYILAGAGAVTIDGKNTTDLGRFTKFAGKGGLGVEYNLPSGVGLFVQGTSYIYKFDRGGFNKTQADLLWNAGLSYRYHL